MNLVLIPKFTLDFTKKKSTKKFTRILEDPSPSPSIDNTINTQNKQTNNWDEVLKLTKPFQLSNPQNSQLGEKMEFPKNSKIITTTSTASTEVGLQQVCLTLPPSRSLTPN